MDAKIPLSVRSAHESLKEDYDIIQKEVESVLMPTCKKHKWHFEDRIKTLSSFSQKLETGRFRDASKIEDFYACTVVVPNLNSLPEAEKFIEDNFTVTGRKPKTGEVTIHPPFNFEFEGTRIYATLKTVNPKSSYQKRVFEIQIKTFLEHAWGYATHDFSYKSEVIDWSRERLAAQIKASLDGIEATISKAQEISKASNFRKTYDKYERKKLFIKYLNNWPKILLPPSLKTLAETLYEIEKNIKVSLEDIRSAVSVETRKGRGKKLGNLSAYGIIVQSLINQNNDKFIKYIDGRIGKEGNSFRVFIPDEIILEPFLDPSMLKNTTKPKISE